MYYKKVNTNIPSIIRQTFLKYNDVTWNFSMSWPSKRVGVTKQMWNKTQVKTQLIEL